MKKILIAIQTVHKKEILEDMTRDALASIKSINSWNVITDDREVNLSTKWNDAIDLGIKWKMDYVLLCNNDILFNEQTIDALVEFCEAHPEYIFVTPTQYFEGGYPEYSDNIDEVKLHWSFVCVNPQKMVDKLGYFDTIFERGTHTDTEMETRARKLGYKMARTESSWFFHHNNSVNRFLPEYQPYLYSNEQKYFKKWGKNLQYEFPYNSMDLSHKFIGEYNGTTQK